MTKNPLGSTRVTRAARVVVKPVWRVVWPSPSSLELPETPARLAQGPAAFVMPAKAVIELDVLDWREVLVTPLAAAETDSETSTVSVSFSWLARTSRPRSVRREAGVQMEPGEAGGPALPVRVASSI